VTVPKRSLDYYSSSESDEGSTTDIRDVKKGQSLRKYGLKLSNNNDAAAAAAAASSSSSRRIDSTGTIIPSRPPVSLPLSVRSIIEENRHQNDFERKMIDVGSSSSSSSSRTSDGSIGNESDTSSSDGSSDSGSSTCTFSYEFREQLHHEFDREEEADVRQQKDASDEEREENLNADNQEDDELSTIVDVPNSWNDDCSKNSNPAVSSPTRTDVNNQTKSARKMMIRKKFKSASQSMRKKYRHYKRTFVFTGAAAAGSSVPFWYNLLSKKTKKKKIDDDVPDNANITVEHLKNEEPASKYLGLKVSFHEDENSDDDDDDDDDENVKEDSESATLFLDKSRSCDSSTEDIEKAMIFDQNNQTNHYYSDEDDDEEENDDGWSTDNGDDDDDDEDDEIVGEQQPTDKIIIDNNANGFNVDDRSSTNNSDWFGSIPLFSTCLAYNEDENNNVEITKEPDCIDNIDTLSVITESQQKETDNNEYHEKLHQTNRTKMFLSKLMCLNYIRRRLHERKEFNDIKNDKETSDDDIEVEYKKERESIGSSNSRKKKMKITNRLRTLIANLRKKLKRQGNDSDYESLTGDIDDDILSVYSTALLGADALESNTAASADAANGGVEAGTWQYYLSTILDPDMLCFEEHVLNNNEKSMDTSNEDSP
jgi:hypothetical protein